MVRETQNNVKLIKLWVSMKTKIKPNLRLRKIVYKVFKFLENIFGFYSNLMSSLRWFSTFFH